ncbi:MAG: hypothetical protein H6741_04055 [Alphaproteobacteria bacterium]|nr:hypothetical protein [Alphaproteobacteria bacterium]MCB9791879.1 hypothetical protein [Alphaproteobacteria bacterium]
MILVTGFGPFPGVPRNPTTQLVRALHGARVAGETITGEVLPVSYARAPARTLALARANPTRLVLGLGVATSRTAPEVELRGRRVPAPSAQDVDASADPALPEGPTFVPASLDARALAEGLGCGLSEDAGAYVCNAWLYSVTQGLPGVPVGFLHVPAAGLEPARLLQGLRSLLGVMHP